MRVKIFTTYIPIFGLFDEHCPLKLTVFTLAYKKNNAYKI